MRERDILNAEEAAEFLGFSLYTTREKARLGEIPGRKVGREWRFSRPALLDFIGECPKSEDEEILAALRAAMAHPAIWQVPQTGRLVASALTKAQGKKSHAERGAS